MHDKEDKAMGRIRLWAAVLGAGLISSWTTALLMKTGSQSRPPTAYEPGFDFSELNAQLDRLTRALQPLSAQRSNEGGQPAAVDRVPVEDSEAWSEVARSLQEIRGLVGRESMRGTGRTTPIVDAGLRQLDTRWEMVGDLDRRFNAERTTTRQSLMFLSPEMVLQRYGRPTSISVTDNGVMRWQYYRGGAAGEAVRVTIHFMDGYVISVS